MPSTHRNKDYSLYKNKNFLLFLTGQNLSAFGDWFRTIATIGLIYELTGKATHLSILFICSMLPLILTSMILSPFIDKYPYKKIMIIADLARLFIGLGFVLAVSINITPFILYLLLALNGAFSGVYLPARSSLIPEILDKDHLSRGNSILTTSFSASMLIATGIGGLVTEILSVETIYFIDALTFLVSAILLINIRENEQSKKREYVSYIQSVKEGLSEIRKSPKIQSALWILMSRELALSIVYVIFSLYILEIADAGNFGLGLGHMVSGLGQIIGGITLAAYFKKTDFTLELYKKWSTLAIIFLAILHTISYQQGSFLIFLILVFLANLWYSPIEVLYSTNIMTYVDNNLRARVFAAGLALSRTFYIFGFILMAFIGDKIPVNLIALGMGSFVILAGLINNYLLIRKHNNNKEAKSQAL
jgi:MFS transporter, DHA3 family, macrolide efflux protein